MTAWRGCAAPATSWSSPPASTASRSPRWTGWSSTSRRQALQCAGSAAALLAVVLLAVVALAARSRRWSMCGGAAHPAGGQQHRCALAWCITEGALRSTPALHYRSPALTLLALPTHACCNPQIFSEVHFGNHFALEGASRKKSEICRWGRMLSCIGRSL